MKIIKKFIPPFALQLYRKYKKKKAIEAYKGYNVFCPICKSEFKTFASFGVIKRKNARCLNCGSLERHRLLYLYLSIKKKLFDKGPQIKLLHFAPEKSFYNIFSTQSNIEYVPCDLFPDLYQYNGNTPVRKIDINDIPFEENYFDVVLCNHVLEHIDDDIHAMKQLYRVLKNGGWAILQVPIDYNRETTYEDFSITDPKEREKVFGQHNHVRWYGKDYKDRLSSVGFKVTEDDYIKRFSPEEINQMGLMSSHLIYYCEK